MKRRSFLAGLLALPAFPTVAACEAVSAVDDFSEFKRYCEQDVVVFDIETRAVDTSRDPWHSGGAIAYRFPNHPAIPTKIARFD